MILWCLFQHSIICKSPEIWKINLAKMHTWSAAKRSGFCMSCVEIDFCPASWSPADISRLLKRKTWKNCHYTVIFQIQYGSQTTAFLDVGRVKHDAHAVTHSLGRQVLLEFSTAWSGVTMGTEIYNFSKIILFLYDISK